jgi:RNA polymerase sigma-70 factor (ECF subfamily)
MSKLANISEASDQEVVTWAREGDEDAYREMLRRYGPPVFDLIYGMVGQRELAEDLAQDTFVKAFRALDRHDPECEPSAWILRIANNTVIDYIRRKRPDSTRSPLTMTPGQIDRQAMRMPTPSVTPMTSTDRREFAAALKRALRRLRPKYRRCFVLRHVEQRSYAEIARIMNLPVSTVGTNLQRAREELKGMLERAAGFGAHPPPHNPTM